MKTILIAAISANGMIAEGAQSPVDWTSPTDKHIFKTKTQEAGVVIFGRRTFEIDFRGKPLQGRLNVILTRGKKLENISGQLHFTDGTPTQVLEEIAHLGYTECVIGGGQSVFTSFLNEGCVDEIWLTLEPIVFARGVHFLTDLDTHIRLSLASVERLGEDELLVKYLISK
jgi:dihydrofolate reductase